MSTVRRSASLTAAMETSANALKDVLREVELDEAEAIHALCALLEYVEESRNFACLAGVRNILKDWQNEPPRGIVTSLIEIRREIECAHENT